MLMEIMLNKIYPSVIMCENEDEKIVEQKVTMNGSQRYVQNAKTLDMS